MLWSRIADVGSASCVPDEEHKMVPLATDGDPFWREVSGIFSTAQYTIAVAAVSEEETSTATTSSSLHIMKW